MKVELKLKFSSIAWKYYCWATPHKKYPVQIPFVMLKDCLSGSHDENVNFKSLFFKALSPSESEVGTDAQQDGLSVVSVYVCILCLCICMCVLRCPFFLSVLNSFGEICLFSPPCWQRAAWNPFAAQTGDWSILRQVSQAQTGSGSATEAGSIVNTAVT